MPVKNRVNPWGRFQEVSEKGALMGNRGILRNADQHWQNKRWITCSLTFPGIAQVPSTSCKYTKLFFLDEATAFSAGHRPCAQCRGQRFKEFKSAWVAANHEKASKPPGIEAVDEKIHADRSTKSGGKVTYEAPLGSLPDGTIVEIDGIALLVWQGALFPWSFEGYGPAKRASPPSSVVRVLTPASVVRAFEAGFTPDVHPSANA